MVLCRCSGGDGREHGRCLTSGADPRPSLSSLPAPATLGKRVVGCGYSSWFCWLRSATSSG